MATDPTRRGVERKFAGVTFADLEPDGAFSGYASLFGKVDMARDAVEAGAFRRSLRQRGPESVRMLYQHDPNQPIGRWTEIREDARGLFVRGRLTPGVARSREVLQLMRAGALDGLSIGFRTVRARKDVQSGVRRILEADLWEISVVTFPMLPEARIAQVKHAARARAWTGGRAEMRRIDRGLRYAPHWPQPVTLVEMFREAARQLHGKDRQW
ncbi:MAG: HK97 family phage prohead protease [Mesorhizobium sp.]|nr:HK97 family phage prohead protease [Mesorhizobium sp.]